MSYRDLSLPQPLLAPHLWPDPDEPQDVLWILSLNLASLSGGPLRALYLKAIASGRFVWRLDFPIASKELLFLRKEEIRIWLASGKPKGLLGDFRLIADFRDAIEGFNFTEKDLLSSELLRSGLVSQAPDARNWIQELVPEVFEILGEVKLRKYLKLYFHQMPEAEIQPFDGLRYFSGFLRKQAEAQAAVAFDSAWAKLNVLFSPHDENFERKRLKPGELIINPTLQVLRDPLEMRALALLRSENGVIERELSWPKAAIIDEISERPRMQISELDELIQHQMASREVRELSKKMGAPDFSLSLQELMTDGIVLLGE